MKHYLLKTCLAMLCLVLGIGSAWAEDVIDKSATSSSIGTTGSTEWTTITVNGTSGAVYKIYTMGTSNTNYAVVWSANGYLVTTQSTKNLKSVTVNAEKSVSVYASNDAYSVTAPSGTALATLTSNTENGTKYTFTSSYKYLALKGSKSCKVNSITIEYEDGNAETILYTVGIETPTNGSLQIKKGENVLSDGDEITAGSNLTITATPADGYKFKNWQYKEGEGSWNTRFTASQAYTMPSADVQFRANFEIIPTYTIAWSVNGSIVKSEDLKEGEAVTAPATPEDINGKTFTGWVETSTVNADEQPEYVTPSTTAEKQVTYYAVFAEKVSDGDATWTVVNNANNLQDGDVVIIATQKGFSGTGGMKTAGEINSSKLLTCTASTFSADGTTITNVADGTLQFTLTKSSSEWQFVNGGKYLAMTGDKNVGFIDNASTWNISISNYVATVSQDYKKSGASTASTYKLQYNYNNGNDRFTGYTSSQTAISLYKKTGSEAVYSNYCTIVSAPEPTPADGTVTFVATDGSDYYATFTNDRVVGFEDIIVGEDGESMATVKVYAVSVIEDQLVLTNLYSTHNDGAYTYIPKNTGVLLKYHIENGEMPLTVPFKYADEWDGYLEDISSNNMLRPASVAKENDGSYLFYKLAYGDWENKTKLGFWWGEDDGAPFVSKAGGVYLAVPVNAAPSNMRGFSFDLEGNPTSIESVSSNVVAGEIYNLQGQRISRLQQGVNIINGKKVIR